jgi:GTPase
MSLGVLVCCDMMMIYVCLDDGQCLYFDEQEYQTVVTIVQKLCKDEFESVATVLNKKEHISQTGKYYTGHMLIRRRVCGKVEKLTEVRVACIGNVDAGKSTLLGVLVSSELDDGRGQARVNLFKHKHEIESGR